jgi:cyclopropane fatty-acyl-phospholipid synthase-like methyltransferase
MNPQIHDHGYWQGNVDECHHEYDEPLSKALVDFFSKQRANSIVDFGCGWGDYVKHFIQNYLNAIGYDGNPNTPEISNNTCKVLDLSKEHRFAKPSDWVMSLEVGEHLPCEFEDIFINNLHHNNTKGIILSWALKGQGGHGHVNEQDNDYIKSKICKLGYLNDIETEEKFRECATLPWFKNTIMVFIKKKKGWVYNHE